MTLTLLLLGGNPTTSHARFSIMTHTLLLLGGNPTTSHAQSLVPCGQRHIVRSTSCCRSIVSADSRHIHCTFSVSNCNRVSLSLQIGITTAG